MNRVLLFWLAMLLVLAGGMLVWTVVRHREVAIHSVGSSHEPISDPMDRSLPKLTEFELLDQTGRRVNSRELAGHVWAGSFFFAACPGPCYNQNIKLQQLHAKYAERGLQVVSITCDPGNDTPAALARYAGRFQADPQSWRFLTPAEGGNEYIRRIANDFFGVAVGPATHTDRVVLFDQHGQIMGAYNVLNVEQYRELDRKIDESLTKISQQAPANS